MIQTLAAETKTNIHFDPEPHIYYDDSDRKYTSVTTLIGRYKKPFNKVYWSMYTALKNNGYKVGFDREELFIKVNSYPYSLEALYRNPEIVNKVSKTVKDWQELTDIACARGNKIHDKLEQDINLSKRDEKGKTNDFINPIKPGSHELIEFKTKHDLDATGLQFRFPVIYEKLMFYINKGCTIYAEKRIYSTTFLIAGMIDVLIVKGKQFAILDWKTNKDVIHFNSGYYKKVKNAEGKWVKSNVYVQTDDRLLAPIDSLQECKGNLYSLQLTLYAYIMMRWGYRLIENGLNIYHIRPNEEPKLVPVRYMHTEIERLLKHHYLTNVA